MLCHFVHYLNLFNCVELLTSYAMSSFVASTLKVAYLLKNTRTHAHFNNRFPGKPGLAGYPLIFLRRDFYVKFYRLRLYTLSGANGQKCTFTDCTTTPEGKGVTRFYLGSLMPVLQVAEF